MKQLTFHIMTPVLFYCEIKIKLATPVFLAASATAFATAGATRSSKGFGMM